MLRNCGGESKPEVPQPSYHCLACCAQELEEAGNVLPVPCMLLLFYSVWSEAVHTRCEIDCGLTVEASQCLRAGILPGDFVWSYGVWSPWGRDRPGKPGGQGTAATSLLREERLQADVHRYKRKLSRCWPAEVLLPLLCFLSWRGLFFHFFWSCP